MSPASEASREVANLTWRKNPHTPIYGVKEFVCVFKAKITLPGNEYPDSHHSQGVWNLPHKFHLYLIFSKKMEKHIMKFCDMIEVKSE